MPVRQYNRGIKHIRKFLDATANQQPVVRLLLVAMPVLLIATMVSALLFGVLGDSGKEKEAKEIAENIEGALEDDEPVGGTEQGGEEPNDTLLPEKIADASKIRARVRYAIQSTTGGKAQNYELTLSQDPPKRAIRVQGTVVIVPGDGSVVICDTNDSCTRIAGLGSTAASMAGAVAGALLNALDPGMDIRDLPGYKEAGTRKIAGLQAGCFSFERDGKVTQCVAVDSGLTLSLTTTGATGKTTKYEAVEVAQPDASDFNPPSEPKNLGL